MIPQFLWGYEWARRRAGGKWERWEDRWGPVDEWSTPRDRPEQYGAGLIPAREEWP